MMDHLNQMARVPGAGASHPADADTLERLLQGRFSCRGFLQRPVPQPTIEAMFTLAQRAPSGCNSQPWHAIVTSGAATERFRAALAAQAATGDDAAPDLPFPTEYRGAYRKRRRDAAWALYESVGVAQGDRVASALQMQRNFSFFGAPHVAVLTTDQALGAYGIVDTGIYLGTLLLAAQSLGIAAVPQGALGEHARFIRSYFDIAPDRMVVCGVSFGYADPDHPANGFRTDRAPLAEAVRFQTG